MICCPRRQRHVGKRRVLASAGRHNRAIGTEQIGRLMRLIKFVEYRRHRVLAHARRSHFMDAKAGRTGLV